MGEDARGDGWGIEDIGDSEGGTVDKLKRTLAERPLSLPLCLLAAVALLVVGTIVEPAAGIGLAVWICLMALLFAWAFNL